MSGVGWKDRVSVLAEKITSPELMREACWFTSGHDSIGMTLGRMYGCEHSPQRTQMFWIKLYGIPTFVSVHFVRHKVGVEHYVRSNRGDRGGDSEANRWTPVNHAMLANAEALRTMALKRLCGKASAETQFVMQKIKEAVAEHDPALTVKMVAKCEYIGRCVELQPCGRWNKSPGNSVP